MTGKTAIQWTDKTWNPVRGCTKVSPGCDNCYAMRQAHRMNHPGGAYEGLTRIISGRPQWNGKTRTVPGLLDQPLRWQKPCMIFVNSMSDLFHPEIPGDFIADVFWTMEKANQHVFQVLTKRPERMANWLDFHYASGAPRNVWLGASAEDQDAFDRAIGPLKRTNASIRWLSLEPLIAPIDIGQNDWLDWVVVGGESGPRSRECKVLWIESVVIDCKEWGIPVFVKQLGARPVVSTDSHVTLNLRHAKGGDISEWPDFLQVRDWPAARGGDWWGEWEGGLRVREYPSGNGVELPGEGL